MKKITIDYKITNNDETINKNNISAEYKKDECLNFKDKDEVINISFDNKNIVMKRDTEKSSITFNFSLNKKTESKYYIKDMNFYIDTKVLTNNLIFDNKRIIIEYELWLSDEYSGKFKYEIIIKE